MEEGRICRDTRQRGAVPQIPPISAVQAETETLEPAAVGEGATCTTSVGEEQINRVRHGSYLVSASSDWDEIDRRILEKLSIEHDETPSVGTRYKLRKVGNPQITLLANGCPINFYNAESIPNAVIDVVLAQLFIAAVELVATKEDLGSGVLLNKVEEVISRRMLVERYSTFQSY